MEIETPVDGLLMPSGSGNCLFYHISFRKFEMLSIEVHASFYIRSTLVIRTTMPKLAKI